MDKTRICMSRTINLAKQKNLKKTNLLAYEKPRGQAKQSRPTYVVPPISAPPAKRIRVCTGAELKRMCPSPPCVCPDKVKRAGAIAQIGNLFKFGLKSLLAGSMIYFTWDAGLWGDSEDTEEFYTNVCHLFTEGKTRKDRLSEACEAEMELMQVPPAPEDRCRRPPFSKERTMYRVKETWNHTVTTVFEFLVGFPYNIIEWYHRKFTEECTPIKKR